MINYPDVTRGNTLSVLFISINNEGELLILFSAGGHLGTGGGASFGFNISEFAGRMKVR